MSLSKKKPVYIIYHKADLDGLFGARACALHLPGNHYPVFVPMQYGEDFSDQLKKSFTISEVNKFEFLANSQPISSIKKLKGKKVMMVDFSLPKSEMDRLNHNTEFYWFDHHISAIKENAAVVGDIMGRRDITQAGCRLALHYNPFNILGLLYYNHSQVIDLLSDYDIWNNKDKAHWEELVLPFQYGMRLEVGLDLCKVFRIMMLINTDYTNALSIEEIIEKGLAIYKNNKQNWESWMRKSGDVTIEYFVKDKDSKSPLRTCKGLALLGPAGGSSQVFESKRDNTIYDVMVYITYNISKKEYSVSLYSDKDTIDCSVIAKHFGGGGHKGASGFVCKQLPFNI